jgi:multimeric flavodoxin WrbA
MSAKKAVLLDGAHADDHTGEHVRAALMAEFASQGWDVEYVLVREKKIGNCAGDFFCWIRTPGVCNLDDDNRTIAAAIATSDLLIYLTPITFGGYSSALKRMVDHQIQNITAHFTTVAGETHHVRRYAKYPDFLAVGWLDAPDAHAEAVFRHLVHRNALNFYAERAVSAVVLTNESDEGLRAAAHRWLGDLESGTTASPASLPAGSVASGGPAEIRRALLLVGSPKTRKSASNSLGTYLFEQLAARSIETETVYLHLVLRSEEKSQALLESVDGADLVVLAFPVYVDSLPAPVIEALERIAAHRQGRPQSRPQLFTAIANCGFPEAAHTATPLAICKTFARQAGFAWAGGLALGGGGIVGDMPLVEGGGRTMLIRKVLDTAAEALAQGQPVPQAARDALARPMIPHWLYRLMAELGWWQIAGKYGTRRRLKQRPYATQNR